MRSQFTFYRSYYEAIKHLPKKDQVSVLMAICAYALDEEDPKLSGAAAASFLLIKPTLDKSNERAKSGKRGGSKKEANVEQTPREEEKEGEIEIEKENDKPSVSPFDLFWEAYPKKVGKADAEKAFDKAISKTTLDAMLKAIADQKQSRQWTEDGGRFIPNPSTWLNQGRWADELAPVAPVLTAYVPRPTQWARDAVSRMMEEEQT